MFTVNLRDPWTAGLSLTRRVSGILDYFKQPPVSNEAVVHLGLVFLESRHTTSSYLDRYQRGRCPNIVRLDSGQTFKNYVRITSVHHAVREKKRVSEWFLLRSR